jgi:ABC-type oligopeptide transport system ATPase subunit
MKEVIDLAFKIVAMQYLHLNNAPIYLDELAASFDKSHREAAYRMVNDLMINSNYSQIYIISHFADSYGSFNNSDVITLHDANISKAKGSAFNKNVQMH